MPDHPDVPYPGVMATDHETTTDELLAAAGITVTEEGKARARERMRTARERMNRPEVRARMREQIGRPPAHAA